MKGYWEKVKKYICWITKKRKLWAVKTDSYKAQMHVYLAWTFKEMHMNFDMFGLSNINRLCRNAVLHQGDNVADLPPHNLMMWCVHHLRPDLMVWPLHTCSIWPWLGMPKIPLCCTGYNRPTTPTPTNEESAWAQWGKNLKRKKMIHLLSQMKSHMWLVWIPTT